MLARLLRSALPLLGIAILIQGCATTGTIGTTTEAKCAAWRKIRYSGSGDSPQTVRAIRVHNQTYENLQCPDK